jgi:hypothetical protein
MSTSSNFASVKLPLSLVQQAKETAQPLRRSTAGQIEYWATLGRVVEHSGLTAQEAQAAIEGYEAANKARQAEISMPATPGSLEALAQGVVAASTNGTLQAHIRRIVEANRQQAVQSAAA